MQTGLAALIDQVKTKLRAGPPSAESLKPELDAFDALLAKYPDKGDASAQILLWKGLLYLQVLNDEAAAKLTLEKIPADFPNTPTADRAEQVLHSISPEAKAEQAAAEAAAAAKLAALVGQPAPEIDFTWSTKAGLKHLADLKGRVVVLDFWATWCGPCIASFPKVRAEVAHFKDSPVTFLGITSLQGRVHGLEAKPIDTRNNPQKEYDLMPAFMKAHDMTWDVAFSQQDVFNPDYVVEGIPYIAIIDPNGVVRHTGLNPHDPSADIEGKVTALLNEFKLAVPSAGSH